MIPPDFDRRLPAFREGFDAFFIGVLDNPFIRWNGDKPFVHPRNFLASREWQHGQDVAFISSQHYNSAQGEYE